MVRYSEEFKESIMQKIMPPNNDGFENYYAVKISTHYTSSCIHAVVQRYNSGHIARSLSENSARSEDGRKLRIKISFCEVNSGAICRTKRNF